MTKLINSTIPESDPQRNSMNKIDKIRYGFVAISILGVLLAIIGYAKIYWESSYIIDNVQLNDLIKAGVQLKVEQSRSLFQVFLLIMAVLWGLFFAKKGEKEILLSDRPELIMFYCANLLLLASAYYHIYYIENITYIYSLAGRLKGSSLSIPDVFGSGINNPYRFQMWCLGGGTLLTLLTLFSAHKLKEGGANASK